MDRVSVSKAALEALIAEAAGDRLTVIGEFCVGRDEVDRSNAEFDALVAALDVRDIAPQKQRRGAHR